MGLESLSKQGQQGRQLPLDIKIGQSEHPIMCIQCEKLKRDGFFVVVGGQAILLCVMCTGTALVKFQTLYPNEKIFETETVVDESVYNQAVEKLRARMPELSESKALDIVKLIVDSI